MCEELLQLGSGRFNQRGKSWNLAAQEYLLEVTSLEAIVHQPEK